MIAAIMDLATYGILHCFSIILMWSKLYQHILCAFHDMCRFKYNHAIYHFYSNLIIHKHVGEKEMGPKKQKQSRTSLLMKVSWTEFH